MICNHRDGRAPRSANSCQRPDISVVVVNYNTAHLFGELFGALDASRGTLNLQVIVIDNASRDGSADILRGRYPNIELIENPTNVGLGVPTIRRCRGFADATYYCSTLMLS